MMRNNVEKASVNELQNYIEKLEKENKELKNIKHLLRKLKTYPV